MKAKLMVAALACSALSTPVIHAQSLEEAVATTLDTNPELRIYFNRYKAHSEELNQAESGYLPSLGLRAGIGREYTDAPGVLANGDDDISLNRKEVGVNVRQVLFDGFATSSDVDRAEYEMEAGQYSLFAKAEDIALETVQAYVGVLQAEKSLELASMNLETHLKIQEQVGKLTDSGLGSAPDLTQVNARLALVRSNYVAARNNVLDAQSKFFAIVKEHPSDLVLPSPDQDMLPKTRAEALELASQNNPTIISAKKDLEAARAERSGAESNYYPTITFEIDASKSDDIDGIEGERTEASAMLKLSYNLFDGLRDSAKIRKTSYQVNEALEVERRAFRQLEEGVDLAWNAYELLGQQIGYLQQYVDNSYATKESYKKQFDLGRRSLLDLLDTENELFESRQSYVEAEGDFLIAQYRLLNATGRLLDSLTVKKPEVWVSER